MHRQLCFLSSASLWVWSIVCLPSVFPSILSQHSWPQNLVTAPTCGQCHYMRHSFLTLGQSSWSDLRLCAHPQLETSSKPVIDPHHSNFKLKKLPCPLFPPETSPRQKLTTLLHAFSATATAFFDPDWPVLCYIMEARRVRVEVRQIEDACY